MSRKSDVSEFNSDFKIRQDDLNQNKHVTETPSHAVSRTVTPFRAGRYRERSSKTGEGDFTPHQWRTQEFCAGGGDSTNSVKDRGQREQGSGGGSPLIRGSGGSCNFVQEILFHIVKFS